MGAHVERSQPSPPRQKGGSVKAWKTRDGRKIPFKLLTSDHLRALARMLRKWPRMPGHRAITEEIRARGLPHLNYPHL